MSWGADAEIAEKIAEYGAHPFFLSGKDHPWGVAIGGSKDRSRLARDETGVLRFSSDEEAWEWIESNLESDPKE